MEQPAQRRPFVALNCSGIPETLLESELFGHARGSFTGAYRDKPGLVRQAERGTLFLDELGEMSLRMQAVLLRFTETGEIQPVGADRPAGRVDVRLITATNRDLRSEIADGKFREDLYLPSERHPAAHSAASGAGVRRSAPAAALPAAGQRGAPPAVSVAVARRAKPCSRYPWPGNVRELKNITERLVVRDVRRPITRDDLPRRIPSHRAGDIAVGPLLGRSALGGRRRAGQRSPVSEVLWQPAARRRQLLVGGRNVQGARHHARRPRR